MYRIEKWNRNEFEWQEEYETWAGLKKDLAYRSKYHNSVFYGVPGKIYKDNEFIGTVKVFDQIDKPIKKVTLAEFVEEAAPLTVSE